MAQRTPPFQENEELFELPPAGPDAAAPTPGSLPKVRFPAAYPNDSDSGRRLVYIDDLDTSITWLKQDLDVQRLNKIHKHLWMAGLPQVSRPLHHHIMIGRQVLVTERADLHLVWKGNKIFLKPLPDYIMSHGVWTEFLCTEQKLFEDAKGFLLSYNWLICHKSDIKIAHELGLISEDVTWKLWTEFNRAIRSNRMNDEPRDINPRYLYGELRLGRLDLIYRFCRKTWSFETFFRGYYYGYHQCSTFVQRNFAWLLTAIIYVTVVLTAMQVGLATTELKDDDRFNRASYGFTVFSILAPLVVVAVAAITVIVLVCINWQFAHGRRIKAYEEHASVYANPRLHQYRHAGLVFRRDL